MGCKECKKKSEFKEKYEETTSYIEKYTILFVIVWSALAVYGLYSLINKFI
jgi:hypothetical protein